ncbi:MAG: SpoIIE family protein phosphatase [Acidobacteria bacterium]|nr:SpoIIE family protein phosphatase [Acidobacteriota bacterium]MCA1610171.1 SpoIIE family protein phosphatase [Acidobacteriota bacterium]MCA1617240.1 SpoIIE family protein phosphatase [Acidobacteriota bacterium]
MPTFIAKKTGRRYEFSSDIEIGRGLESGLSIEDPTISRRHAAMTRQNREWWIRDLGSQNGTGVNGRSAARLTRLRDGDQVRLGEVFLEFRRGTAAKPAERRMSVVTLSDRLQSVIRSLPAEDPEAAWAVGPEKDAKALGRARRKLQVLSSIATAISETVDEDAMFRAILEKLFEVFPQAERGFVMVREGEEELQSRSVRTRSGERSEIAISRTIVSEALTTRRGVLSLDAASDDRFAIQKSIRIAGIRSVLCVPLIARDRVYGIVGLDSTHERGAFDEEDLALLVGVAGQTALAIANARLHREILDRELLDQDLALARRIQFGFLPRTPPRREGFDFRAHYQPALEVGGDYYDFLDLPGGRLGIAVGDVSGKGVSAALYMVKVRGEVRYHSAGVADPGEILARVNRAICRDMADDGMFVTAVLLVLDPARRRLTVASAGHMPPVLRRADGALVVLASPHSAPLGAQEDAEFLTAGFDLTEGDTVLAYTDGISEAVGRREQLFGDERLRAAVRAAPGSPEEVLAAVLDAVREFSKGEPQSDDLTLLAFGPVSIGSTRRRSGAAPVGAPQNPRPR